MDEEYIKLKQRCCECSFWIKYIIFTVNFLIWVLSISLMVIGIWARLQKAKLGSIDNLSTDPAFFLILIGCLMLFISSFGCFGALRENLCLLKAFSISIVIVFLCEIIGGILTFVFLERFQSSLISYMQSAVKIYQDDKDLQNAMDYIQETFSCCGASSYRDWDMNLYYNCSSPSQFSCGVPTSCCKPEAGSMASSANVLCGIKSRIEGEIYASHTIYTKGCIHPLMHLLKDNMLVIGILAFTIGFIELVSIILAHLLMRIIVRDQRLYHQDIRLQIVQGSS